MHLILNQLREHAVLTLSAFTFLGLAFVFLCSRLTATQAPRINKPSKERVLLIQSLIFIFMGGLILSRNAEDVVGWAVGFGGLASLAYLAVKILKRGKPKDPR